jgi:hypothetical protein
MLYDVSNEWNFSQIIFVKEGIMNRDIEAIFLDVGNTLRIVVEEPDFMQQAKRDLITLVHARGL